MSAIEIDIEKFIQMIEENDESLFNFFKEFDYPKYKPSDLGISARVINYWQTQNLLFENEQGWHKFNLHQAVWVLIVKQLRELNISVKAILKIKAELLQVPNYNEIFSKQPEISDIQEALAQNNMTELASLIESGEFQTELRKSKISILQLLLFDLMGINSNWRLLFNSSGEVVLHKDNYEQELKDLPGYINFLKTTHISISLNTVLYEITNNLVENEDLKKLHILNEKEIEIIEATRKKNVKKVEILFSETRTPELIKITEVNKLDTASRIKELLLTNGYQDIKITTQNGNVVHFENTTKKKL